MIEYIKICIPTAILSAVLMMVASKEKELANVISSFIFTAIVIFAVTRTKVVIDTFNVFWGHASYSIYFDGILSVIGIAVLGAVTASLCENFGQRSIAQGIEALTVIEVLYMTLPWILELFSDIANIFGD